MEPAAMADMSKALDIFCEEVTKFTGPFQEDDPTFAVNSLENVCSLIQAQKPESGFWKNMKHKDVLMRFLFQLRLLIENHPTSNDTNGAMMQILVVKYMEMLKQFSWIILEISPLLLPPWTEFLLEVIERTATDTKYESASIQEKACKTLYAFAEKSGHLFDTTMFTKRVEADSQQQYIDALIGRAGQISKYFGEKLELKIQFYKALALAIKKCGHSDPDCDWKQKQARIEDLLGTLSPKYRTVLSFMF